MALYDKNGTPIERGDIVKVYHFTGARRKQHYMYKQAIGLKYLGLAKSEPYMRFSHLNMTDEYYVERMCERHLPDYEVVQSVECDHEDRPRVPATQVAAAPVSLAALANDNVPGAALKTGEDTVVVRSS